jgi:hypothetical protein
MKAIKLSAKIVKNNPLKFNIARFGDKFKEKELAEEKIYFDKQESNSFLK